VENTCGHVCERSLLFLRIPIPKITLPPTSKESSKPTAAARLHAAVSRLIDVRFRPHCGLMQNIAPCPKSARSGSDQPIGRTGCRMAGRDAALLLVAEHDDPAMFARIDVIRALNRHFERVFDPSRKDTRWGRRRLGIDDESKQVWRDVSRYAAHLPAALPAAHSRELRPSALVAGPSHPPQTVPSLA
jgi:hypothetical protein